MSEPTVQVPVSQIERWADDLRRLLSPGTYAIRIELAALLAQPTPTAEPPLVQVGGRRGGKTTAAIDALLDRASERGIQVQIIEPPRIEDMAPGTHAYIDGRFGDDGVCHAHMPGQTNYSAWPGRCYRPRADRVHLDPSTIRDVTQPAVTS